MRKQLFFVFVPGHAVVRRNKHTDKLTGIATMGIKQGMDQNYILNAIIEAA